MNARFARPLVTALLLSTGIFACSVTTTDPTKTTGTTMGGSSAKAKPQKQALNKLAKSTPPDGATSEGTKTKPTAGGSTIPIVDTEVYLVVIDFDGDGTDDNVNWAHTDEGITYLWWEGAVTCDDGLSDGTGGFAAEIADDGSGSYMFVLDECPEQNLHGCEFDTEGNETSCGACAWDEEVIACVEEQ